MANPVRDALQALVAEAAASYGAEPVGAKPAAADGSAAYAIGETVIVAVTGASVEFRLRADVAAAAARTPDAAPSPRGPEWVAFSPTTFDRFTRDRIESWIEFAARQVSP